MSAVLRREPSILRVAPVPRWLVPFFALAVLVLFSTAPGFTQLSLTETGIRLRTFGIPSGTVSYASIAAVEPVSYAQVLFGGNPLRTVRIAGGCGRSQLITVHRRSGWFNRLVLCPPDSAAFLRAINARLPARPSA